MDVVFKNISDNLNAYTDMIDAFVKSLDSEKEFFHSICKKMIMESPLVIAAIDKNEIVGVTGVERKYFLHKGYALVKKKYQGKGFGLRFFSVMLHEAKKECDLVLGVVKPNNIRGIKLNYDAGYKIIGRRDNHEYMAVSFNAKGRLLFNAIKIILPLLNVMDRVMEKVGD